MDENVVAALGLLADASADPLDVARACETLKAFADARQLAAIRQVSLEQPEFLDPFGELCDPAPAEVACALTWTPMTATRRMALAHDLHDGLPDVLHALRTGEIDLGKATDIAVGTTELSPGTRMELAERACVYAATHTRGQLRAWLARWVARLDPDAAQKRRKTAKKQRRVWVQPETDGMATLGAYLTAEEAQACLASLLAGAANHEGGVDAARADLLVERLCGVSPAEPIPVQILILPDGIELAGHGPLSPDHARELCDGQPRIHLDRPTASRGYRPSPTLARYIRARDRHCQFPGCRRPAVHCDLDHITPYPAGRTDEPNLHCLCRHHHRLKTHTPWTTTGTTWTSPRGRHYQNDP